MTTRLKRREKIVVVGGIALLIFFLVYQFVILPIENRVELLERIIPKKEKELHETVSLKNEYETLGSGGNQKIKKTERKGKSTVTLSYLEDLAQRAGLKDNIQYMKPLSKSKSGRYLQNSMEIKLLKVPAEGLTRFLYDIEKSDRPLSVTELDIRTNKRDSSYLDVRVQITSFELV